MIIIYRWYSEWVEEDEGWKRRDDQTEESRDRRLTESHQEDGRQIPENIFGMCLTASWLPLLTL